MSFARLRNSLLAARDRRQQLLAQHPRRAGSATVVLSLNLPGEDKRPPGADGLFAWAQAGLEGAFPDRSDGAVHQDALGPFAVMQVDLSPAEAKRRCLGIETAQPFARLVDLDVYDDRGRQIDRAGLGLPARRCLACGEPAAECMRLRRHGPDEIRRIADELLAPFRT